MTTSLVIRRVANGFVVEPHGAMTFPDQDCFVFNDWDIAADHIERQLVPEFIEDDYCSRCNDGHERCDCTLSKKKK